MFSGLWADETGQDMVEFTLLLAFITLVSTALLLLSGDSVAACWSSSQNNLSRAENIARTGY